jgi:hypothetical protein
MVKGPVPPQPGETVCPVCGAGIKTSASAKRRRVQCPKCREVVDIESALRPGSDRLSASSVEMSATAGATTEVRGRLESLEARVEVLEAALRDAMTAARANAPGAPQRKLLWISATPGQPPQFSREQGDALVHNLGGVRSQAITIRTPAGDPAALAHAEWFKANFERAGWAVHGPEEITTQTPIGGLSLAVPELPVARDAAATYLALKAAGFEPTPVLDSNSKDEAGKPAAAIALTVPGKAA